MKLWRVVFGDDSIYLYLSIDFATLLPAACQGRNPSRPVPAQSTTAHIPLPLNLLAVIKSEYSDEDMTNSEL